MKFAILGDMHGNYDAFEACMNDILAKENVNAFLFTGDFCTDFLEGNKIITYIQNLSKKYPVYAVKGNRDQDLINAYHDLALKNDSTTSKKSNLNNWFLHNFQASFLLSFSSLDDQNINWLNNLPDCLEIDIPNTKPLLLVHNLNSKNLTKEKKTVSQILQERKIDTVVTGHTHVPGEFIDHIMFPGELFPTGITILNPGSAGLTEIGIQGADYATLEWKQNNWNFNLHHIPYDYNNAKSTIKAEAIINDISMKGPALIASIESGKNVTSIFFKELKRLGNLYEQTKSTNPNDYPNVDYNGIWTSGRGEDCSLDGQSPLIFKATKQPTPYYNPMPPTKMPNLDQLPKFIFELAMQHTLGHVSTFLKETQKESYLEITNIEKGVSK